MDSGSGPNSAPLADNDLGFDMGRTCCSAFWSKKKGGRHALTDITHCGVTVCLCFIFYRSLFAPSTPRCLRTQCICVIILLLQLKCNPVTSTNTVITITTLHSQFGLLLLERGVWEQHTPPLNPPLELWPFLSHCFRFTHKVRKWQKSDGCKKENSQNIHVIFHFVNNWGAIHWTVRQEHVGQRCEVS